jgi:hypothetical protein
MVPLLLWHHFTACCLNPIEVFREHQALKGNYESADSLHS